MNLVSSQDTIVAVATAMGGGAIGIVRLSGPQAWTIAGSCFQRTKESHESPRDPEWSVPPSSHRLIHGFIIDHQSHRVIDEVLVAFMKAPHSYTREDVVEIQSHSGAAVLQSILTMVQAKGARLAEPGEFTRRAFLNGRIDLSQAEAVAELINARTRAAMYSAANQLSGGLKTAVQDWLGIMKTVLVDLEAGIEFEAEVDGATDGNHIKTVLGKRVAEPIEKMIDDYNLGHIFMDGVRMDIVGRPNVGKSSLFNRLAREDRAIVTPIPGTTRDLIEASCSIRGVPFTLTDTAGLHKTQDPVERIGIEKTQKNIARSHIILFVLDATRGLIEEDISLLEDIGENQIILVINKIDLDAMGQNRNIPNQWSHLAVAEISALTGAGMDTLKTRIAELCIQGDYIHGGEKFIPNLRQVNKLKTALDRMSELCWGIDNGVGDELLADDLEGAIKALEEITGERHDDQILDEIFNRFCIGK